MQPDSAIVLMSGGLDSTACAHFLKRQGLLTRGLFIDFGQAAAEPEGAAVKKVSSQLGIEVETISFRSVRSYTAGEITGRNAFLILAALVSAPPGKHLVGIGIHAGTPYFDCSPQFLKAIGNIVQDCSNGRCSVVAPFVNWPKGDIHAYLREHNVPIDCTYSCELGALPPCGECLSCKDREMLDVG